MADDRSPARARMQKLRADLGADMRSTTTGADRKGGRTIVRFALGILGSDARLQRKLAACGTRDEKTDSRMFCQHPACPVCMRRRGDQLFRERLWPALSAVPPEQLRWVTVLMFSHVSLDDGAREMDRQHRRLQHVLRKFAAGTGKSNRAKVRVWGAREVEREGTEWLFHVHPLIDLAGAASDTLAEMLRVAWGRGDRQVQVKIMERREHEANVLRLARYMTKARYTMSVGTGPGREWMSNEDIVALALWRDRQPAQWHRFTWGVRGL